MDADVIVIGGGLSGLWTALGLEQIGLTVILLEGRDRLGGRILAASGTGAHGYDLGPAWVWPDYQPRIQAVAELLGLSFFPQATGGRLIGEDAAGQIRVWADTFISAPASMRVRGGFALLTARLAARLSPSTARCRTTVTGLTVLPAGVVRVIASADGGEVAYVAPIVVLALPPRLAADLHFTPSLARPTLAVLQSIPTWMAGQAKALICYPVPFWRAAGYSGQAYSQIGPLGEIHDASIGPDDGALFGFFAWPRARRARLAGALVPRLCAQLGRLFGPQAAAPTQVLIQDWATEPLTATAADAAPSTGHPPYQALAITDPGWVDHLILAGTETAPEQGGYLEGAVLAADRAVARIQTGRYGHPPFSGR